MLPDTLIHYYERKNGPFLSLSDLTLEEAETVLERIRQRGDVFASRRSPAYVSERFEIEERIRGLFTLKGGRPQCARPLYFVLGECAWFETWYRDAAELRIALAQFDPATVSFTYGDSFPAMHMKDGRPYRGKVYTLAELPGVVAEYGLPQEWNPDGKFGPERYIEAQVWSLEVNPPDRGLNDRMT